MVMLYPPMALPKPCGTGQISGRVPVGRRKPFGLKSGPTGISDA